MSACTDGAPVWSRDSWERIVRDAAEATPSRLLLVARGSGGEVAGWLVASLVGELTELEGVLVGVPARRQGVAQQMVTRWLAWAQERGVERALLEVRRLNEGARRLYRNAGFLEVGCRKRYYREPVEDAVVMGREWRAHGSGVAEKVQGLPGIISHDGS